MSDLKFGWVRDLPDHRDHKFELPKEVAASTLPAKADIRANCPHVYDQGNLGSCVGNAVAAALAFDEKKQNFTQSDLSRLFIYYNARALEGSVSQDAGCQIRDAIKSVNSQGACLETIWPYIENQFATKPSSTSYQEAAKHESVDYAALTQTATRLKGCIHYGLPFVFGFACTEMIQSDQVATSGMLPYPGKNESIIGGHAVMCVGYDDDLVIGRRKGAFLIRNSWGSNWGLAGYFWMPYAYVLSANLADDFWVIRTVNG